jgi:DNA-binding transcriptional LysR family regulator
VRTLSSPFRWPFRQGSGETFIDVKTRVLIDSGDAALRLAIAGCGITRLADLVVSEAIRHGRLEPVLAESHVADPVPLSAVYPQGRHRMPKVRAFLDFLVERFSHAPWRLMIIAFLLWPNLP